MKRILVLLLAAGALCTITTTIVSNRLRAAHAAELAQAEAAWQAEKDQLETALADAEAHPQIITVPSPSPPVIREVPAPPSGPSPAEMVANLRSFNSGSGSGQTRNLRQALYWFEKLIAAGPAALPAVREFLAANEELDYSWPGLGRSTRAGTVPTDFLLPPSLRFGMFDVLRQIGGAEASEILAEVLGTTGRGVEVAWLARALEGMAPGKYRELALSVAHELLVHPAATNSSQALDGNDRNNLFSVLILYGDNSYVGTAQAQLVQADGGLDRTALKYLQDSLGQRAVPIAAQAYDDPRLTDPGKKEPLVRMALAYVGADDQANSFYEKAIDDMALSKGHRKNLIEDLNEDGFADPKNLTPNDLPLIENRMVLIEELAPYAADRVNAAAFKEAYKDLVNMRKRLVPAENPGP